MAWEYHWDETWERIDPGHYVNGRGMEIVRTGPRTWTLTLPMGDEETRHRTLRAAQAAADEL